MKNTGLYIFSGVTLAAVVALAYVEYRRGKNASVSAATQQAANPEQNTPLALQKFRGFNMNRNLNSQTKQAVPEITALQHMINAYYDGEASIPVTGVYDTYTQNAVMDITTKSATSLKEFAFQYLQRKRGAMVYNDLMRSITITGS